MKAFHVISSPGSLSLSGELDHAAAPQILAGGTAAINDSDAQTLIVDLAGVSFMDSSAVGALVRVGYAAQQFGQQLVIVNVPTHVQRLAQVTGLEALFGVTAEGELTG